MVISYSQLMKLSTKKDYTVEINRNESKTITTSNQYKNYTLYFKGVMDISGFEFSKEDRDLIIVNGKSKVKVTNYFSADGTKTSSQVKYIKYDYMGGTTVSILDEGFISADWLNFSPNKKGVVTGSMFSDSINMTNSLTAPLNSKNKGLTINGGKGGDDITGTAFNDVISGGAGINTYNYDFGKQSGQDTIKLTKGETLKLNLKNGNQILNCEDVSYAKLLNNLIIYRNGDMSNMINLSNFFKLNVNVQIADNSMNDYLKSNDFEGLNISGVGKIAGTNYNDMIMGSDKNDTITAKAGNDTISTNGGKDTVVETGEYGHDIIDSSLSSKVTVKLSSFDANNITYGNDLKYTTDDNSSFTYLGFGTGESADLWISAGKKSYHVTKENAETVDYSKDKSNHIVFLTGDNQTVKTSGKGVNVFYALDGTNDYTLKGGNDSIVDEGNDDDTYTATVNKSTKLVINDDGGNDSLTLTNNVKDLVLYFNVDKNETLEDASDLVIYNKSAMTYKNITNSVKSGNYTGAVDIKDYFAEGSLETINIKDVDFEGWKYFVTSEVGDFLKDLEKGKYTSAEDVFLNGTKAQKTALLNVFKNSNYQTYLKVVDESLPLTSTKFVKNNNDLKVVITHKDGTEGVTTVKDFFKDGAINNNLAYYALDEKGALRKYIIGSTDLPIYINGEEEVAQGTDYSDYIVTDGVKTINLQKGDDTVVFTDKTQSIDVTTANGSHDTFIFEDKKYTDFYTTGELSGAYTAGDPLIAKDGNDLKIGSVTVKDIDGMKNEIQIVDKDGKTKNIIIGQGTINGTHESEIIIGSNTADTINSNGRNDLIYMGDGNDTLNMTKTEGGVTGKNTAEMIGIGGTHSISNDLDVPAISVYDSTGNDTYNTTLKEFGLYIEDFAGNNDTLNITYSDNNLMYLFDVVNPKHASENPTLYTDLMICDKSQFTDAGLSAFSTATGGFKAMLESMQGTFGYAWIDDHFGGKQEIENINIIDADGNSSALDVDAAIASTQQKIAAWLSSDTGFFKPSGDFSTAWDVLERGSKADKAYLATLYMS